MSTAAQVEATTSNALFHIVFVSTATESLSMRQLRELIGAAARRNATLDITGLLLHANGRFMGALEGSTSALEEILQSIRADHRHKNVDVLRFEALESRLFSTWQMGLRHFTVDLETLPFVSPFLDPGFDTGKFQDEPNTVYRALMAFRKEHVTSQVLTSHPAPS